MGLELFLAGLVVLAIFVMAFQPPQRREARPAPRRSLPLAKRRAAG